MYSGDWDELRARLSLPPVPDDLLEQAFRHGSFVRELDLDRLASNQRLEFLGDSVLGLVVAEELYRQFPQLPEGDLTKLKAATVRAESLAQAARVMRLGEYLRLGRGEEDSGGRDKTSLLADSFEALVGAVYLAAGLGAGRQLILKYLPLADEETVGAGFDHKTALQELVQRFSRNTPDYVVLHTTGPAHQLTFTVEARFARQTIGTGTGRSKREAEQAAAGQALATTEQWLAVIRVRE
jgi:ribonuclease-3